MEIGEYSVPSCKTCGCSCRPPPRLHSPPRGGLGCQRGRQAGIDDRERYQQGAALSCCVTSLSLCGGGPVRAGAAFGRRAAWNQKEGQLRSGQSVGRDRC